MVNGLYFKQEERGTNRTWEFFDFSKVPQNLV